LHFQWVGIQHGRYLTSPHWRLPTKYSSASPLYPLPEMFS
jgi:hypothetical protein